MTDAISAGIMLNLPKATLGAVHRAVGSTHSPAEAAALLRQIGFETGQEFLQAFRHWLEHHRQEAGADPASLSTEEFWSHLSAYFSSLGWGRMDFEQLHSGVGALSSQDWAEADAHEGGRQPACHFSTGMLADLLSRLIGADLAVMEVDCRGRGDARCRFLLGGAEALQRVYAGLRQGNGVDAAVRGLA